MPNDFIERFWKDIEDNAALEAAEYSIRILQEELLRNRAEKERLMSALEAVSVEHQDSTAYETLERENEILRGIVRDFHWMARRYVDGRSSYVTGLFNDHVRDMLRLGIEPNQCIDKTIWARDSGGRAYDGLTEEEATAGTAAAMGRKEEDAKDN